MNILVVDDMPTNRKLLRAILEAEAHTVVEAADGTEALAVLAHEKMEAIISDILMPRMDGYRFCYEVRSSEHLRHLPFIFYTSTYTSPSDEKLALEMGADKFLTKPAPAAEVLRALREATMGQRSAFTPPAPSRELNLMKEYNQQLVMKLEQKNDDLAARNEELVLLGIAMETAANAVIITDTKGTTLWVNPAFTTLTGYTAEEAIGQNPRLLKSGKHDREFYKKLWATILTGNTWHDSFTNRRKDGSLYYDEHTITPVRSKDGSISYFVAIMNDVTERKKAEEALHKSEERFHSYFEFGQIGMAITSPDKRLIDINDKICQILGYERSELLRMTWPEITHPDDLEADVTQFNRLLAGEIDAYSINKRFVRKDGRIIDASISVKCLRHPDGSADCFLALLQDITEQRRAEQALRESESKFRALFEAATDGIFIVHNGVFVDCNAKGLEFFGVPRNQLIGQSPDRFSLPVQPDGHDSQEKAAAIIKGALAGQPQSFEWVHHRPDGTLVHTEVNLSRFELNGEVYLQSIARDMTDRRRAEESLRLFRTLLDRSNDAIEVIDAETGLFLDVNETACRRLGYSREEMLSLRFPDVVDSGDVPLSVRDAVEGTRKTGSRIIEARHRRKDGSTFPVEVNVQYIDLNQGYLISVVRDTTERKQAEEQIAAQAALLDKARDAILVRDLVGNILFWNRGAERVYGWTREEIIGRNVDGLLYADPKKFEEINGLAISQGEWQGELQHFIKDRREITVESRWTLIRDNEGRPKSVLSINTDVTDRKKIEVQFMRAQRMESIGTLAGGIAHDLNNILAPIMMSIDILKSGSEDPQTTKILETIEVSAKRGADIVRQVLSFARGLEGERIEIQPAHLLKDLEHIIKDTFPKDIRLHFSVPNDIWTILGDPTQVHQVLLNLSVNARDAMPNGGDLTFAIDNCVLDQQYAAMNLQAKAGRYIRISVTDTGMGIPSHLIDKIFEPFFTTKEVNKGTGLGLSTVLAVVKSHGGIINVYSEPGRGTTFKVYLPAAETSSGAPKEAAESAPLPRGKGETVLVVDDEASILTITRQTLQAFGYRVLTATDGADAVAAYARHMNEIDVVLTDMMMPIMDGPATIHALKRINPALKIVAASGLQANDGVARASAIGVKHFVTKPCTAGTLLKVLRAILDEA